MGVPRFYRWIIERYPLIIRDVGKGEANPVVDNLYLDLNGVVHTSARADEDERPVVSEEDIILNAFQSIDMLVSIAQPQRMIYFAIDGVAPRAKMNQQRSRRFKSAKERAEEAQKAAETDLVKRSNYFDSNCITPGTAFMAKLTDALEYYIEKKIKEDLLWADLEIVFSGPNAPGEGEHKIMDYIRAKRAAGDFGANTRHCMYGLDADLIMLSLATHEPHFVILREKVVFEHKSSSKRALVSTPKMKYQAVENLEFELLSIGVLRDYIDAEFRMAPVPFYNLENVIDDLVMMFFIVGNDFLPALPALDIGEGALDMLIRMYKHLLPKLGGFINTSGQINFQRLERIFAELAKIEGDTLMRRKQAQDKSKSKRGKAPKISIEDLWNEDIPSMAAPGSMSADPAANGDPADSSDYSDVLTDDGLIDLVNMTVPEGTTDAYSDQKKQYYQSKLGFQPSDTEQLRALLKSFAEALSWTLQYYYCGCPSWRWYYPYHYSPMVSNLTEISRVAGSIHFDEGGPFLPFEQLMSVLPPNSSWALPVPYQNMMMRTTGPLAAYYPRDFGVDLDGKRNPWEGIALLPFVDEDVLRQEMAKVDPSELTAEERRRNEHHESRILKRNKLGDLPSKKKAMVASPVPSVLPGLVSAAESRTLVLPPMMPFTCKLPDGYLKPSHNMEELGCWPTLESIPFFGSQQRIQVNVSGYPSRYSSYVLSPGFLADGEMYPFLGFESVQMALDAGMWPGTRVLADYPFQADAMLVKLMDADVTASLPENGSASELVTESNWKDQFLDKKMKLSSRLFETKALRLLDVKMLAFVRYPETIDPVSRQVTAYSATETCVPSQMLLPWVDRTLSMKNLDRISVGDQVLCMDKGPFQGSLGVVESITAGDNKMATVHFSLPAAAAPEVAFSHKLVEQERKAAWHSLRDIAGTLKMWPPLTARAFGNFYVFTSESKKSVLDLGLGLKSVRSRSCKPGYARMQTRSMASAVSSSVVYEYSDAAKKLMLAYQRAFPEVLKAMETLIKGAENDMESYIFSLESVLPPGKGKFENRARAFLSPVATWLAGLESKPLQSFPVSAQVLSKPCVEKLEIGTKRMLARRSAVAIEVGSSKGKFPPEETTTKVTTSLSNLERGSGVPRDGKQAVLFLGDRVVNRLAAGPVPFGTRGTVVGIHTVENATVVDIVYDDAIIGGVSLSGRCSDGHGRTQLSTSLATLWLKKWTKADDLSRYAEITTPFAADKAGERAADASFRPVPVPEQTEPEEETSTAPQNGGGKGGKKDDKRKGRDGGPPQWGGAKRWVPADGTELERSAEPASSESSAAGRRDPKVDKPPARNKPGHAPSVKPSVVASAQAGIKPVPVQVQPKAADEVEYWEQLQSSAKKHHKALAAGKDSAPNGKGARAAGKEKKTPKKQPPKGGKRQVKKAVAGGEE